MPEDAAAAAPDRAAASFTLKRSEMNAVPSPISSASRISSISSRGDSGAPSFIKSDRIRCRAAVNKEQPTLCQSLHERQHQLRIAGRSRSLVIIYPAHIRHGVQIRFYDA